MNHRCGERHPANVTVLLRRRGWIGWVVGELQDISVSGAFCRVPQGALRLRAQVRLEAETPGGVGPRLMHCNAMVARVTRNGVGLVFDELSPVGLAPLLSQARHCAAPAKGFSVRTGWLPAAQG